MLYTKLKPIMTAFCFIGVGLSSVAVNANTYFKSTDSNQPINSLQNLSSLSDSADKKVFLNTPTIHEFATSKGTKVFFVQAKQLPIVDYRITFNAGSARDSWLSKLEKTNVQGTASLVASMLNKGVSKEGYSLNETEIASIIENNGFVFSAEAYKDMFAVSMRSLSDKGFLTKSVNLVSDMLAYASFPKESFERVKAQRLIGLTQAAERPNNIASKAFTKALYGKHPYALPSSGTLETVANISKTHLHTFRNQFLVAQNASIAITGNLTLKEAQLLAENLTSSIPEGNMAAQLPTPKQPSAKHVHVKFDSNQTTIIAGQLGINKKSHHLYDLMVANDIFGGGDFQAILMTELRKKRGLTYGAYSGFTPMQVTGPFSISFSTRNNKAKEALKLTKKSLKNYLKKGADAARINETKQSLVNQYPLTLATNSSINGMLAMMAFYGLPKEYLEDYPLNVMAVTSHSANKAFNNKVSSKNLVIVTVGPKKP